jgi:glycosyltransferase involved in cell wall biosynthesis
MKSNKADKVIIVMPAYNAYKTLTWTYKNIPSAKKYEIVLVDDGSIDKTSVLAKKLGLRVITLPHNVGYGGNQKICYLEALRLGAESVIMLHPDGQYHPSAIPNLLKKIDYGYDVVLGSRFLPTRRNALKIGMPFYKYLANSMLTSLQNLIFGLSLSEFHTGYRAYSRRFLETVPFLRNSNGFVFDSEILAQAAVFDFKMGEVPIKSRYFKDASSVNFRNSIFYGLKTLEVLLKYILQRTRFFKFEIFKP